MTDENKNSKIFLLLAFTSFIAAAYSISTLDFSFSEVFDLKNHAAIFARLYSVSFIIFLLGFSIAIAAAMKYSEGEPIQKNVWLSLPLTGLALFFILLSTKHLPVFIALTAAIILAGILSSLNQEKSGLSKYWKLTGKALTVLFVIALVFAFVKTQENNDYYVNVFFSSAGEYFKGTQFAMPVSSELIKTELEKTSQGKQIIDSFPILTAFAVATMTSSIGFFVKIIATLAAFAFSIIFGNKEETVNGTVKL